MLRLTSGDILRADAEVLVNTVNCVGFMGRGIAAQFKRAFPANFAEYKRACDRKEMVPGKVLFVRTGELTNPRYIANFPTKRHWRAKSRLEDIEAGLVSLVEGLVERRVRSVAVPPLGCGLGGLDWSDVRPRIEQALAKLSNVDVLIYEPTGAPPVRSMARAPSVPKMTTGRAVLVALMEQYLSGLLDPVVSLLEVHKLLYFAQEAGQPLRLRYVKAVYGPYADNLRQVLARVEGHFVSGYADGGDDPAKELQPIPGAPDEARKVLANDDATRQRFERVARLVSGFETPFGMELLATVHWLAAREEVPGPDGIVEAAYAWNERKRRFSPRQLKLAWNHLANQEWIALASHAASLPQSGHS